MGGGTVVRGAVRVFMHPMGAGLSAGRGGTVADTEGNSLGTPSGEHAEVDIDRLLDCFQQQVQQYISSTSAVRHYTHLQVAVVLQHLLHATRHCGG